MTQTVSFGVKDSQDRKNKAKFCFAEIVNVTKMMVNSKLK